MLYFGTVVARRICYREQCLQKTFVADMKDAVLYTEKFITSKFRPTLSNYGGKAIDGFIVVTASGLVCVVTCTISLQHFFLCEPAVSIIGLAWQCCHHFLSMCVQLQDSYISFS